MDSYIRTEQDFAYIKCMEDDAIADLKRKKKRIEEEAKRDAEEEAKRVAEEEAKHDAELQKKKADIAYVRAQRLAKLANS